MMTKWCILSSFHHHHFVIIISSSSSLHRHNCIVTISSSSFHHHHSQKQSPLAFWKLHAATYPILSRVARKYLAIHASSAAVERMFSYTGHRVSKKNTNLADETLLSMMLVRSLSKFVEKWEHVLDWLFFVVFLHKHKSLAYLSRCRGRSKCLAKM